MVVGPGGWAAGGARPRSGGLHGGRRARGQAHGRHAARPACVRCRRRPDDGRLVVLAARRARPNSTGGAPTPHDPVRS